MQFIASGLECVATTNSKIWQQTRHAKPNMQRKVLNSIIMGAPGGGKGTISKKLVKDFGFTHISTGDLLRKNITEKTAIGLAAQSYMKDGKLVPDDVVLQILQQELKRDTGKSILLDGFPRTTYQASKLKEFFNIDVVISLDIPHQVIIERLGNRWIHTPSSRTYSYDYNPPKVKGIDDVTGEALSQREDDKPHVVKKRLEEYASMTAPLLVYYKELQASSKGATRVAEFQGSESDVIYKSVKPFLVKEMHLPTVDDRV